MSTHEFEWAVVGAGPAGIAAVGKLLDAGISSEHILWIDPHFKVGDLGLLWRNVSSNTKVKYFQDFLFNVRSFAYQDVAADFELSDLAANDTCTLEYIAKPLQWVTDELMQRVVPAKTHIHKMSLVKRRWTLCSDLENYIAKNVILATGALPSSLNYPGTHVIPFELAIDKEKLAAHINLNETYGVFGSSHSAMIVVRHLVELGVKRVINFYRSPCRYAMEMDNWILFDNTGLKGQTADWAREYIDGVWPENLVRYNTSEPNITRFLPECKQVIYAVGFEKRKNLVIGDYEDSRYNPHVGIIGPGLFGLGIAYPELKTDAAGNQELQVGLWKFIVYLNKVLPIWLRYST